MVVTFFKRLCYFFKYVYTPLPIFKNNNYWDRLPENGIRPYEACCMYIAALMP